MKVGMDRASSGWGARALFLTFFVLAMLLAVPQAGAQSRNGSAKPAAAKTASAKPSAARTTPAKKAPTKKAATKKAAVRKAPVQKRVVRRAAPPRPSVAQLQGLRATGDPLDLHSSVALVIDQDTDEILFSKNHDAILPIASITKLMTALVVAEADLPLDETLRVSLDDVRATSASRAHSRLLAGTALSRGDLMHLALMSSDNRAAYALGRTYPGGISAFVSAMNRKARDLGMGDTRYVEPTGLSADNRSSAQDLARLVRAASDYPVIRELSTSLQAVVPVGTGKKQRPVQFRNTNGLVHNPEWDIGLQKTGFISAAGRCVVMQAQLAGRSLIMVLLDSAGRYTRIGDAERLRKWVGEQSLLPSFLKSDPVLAPSLPEALQPVAPMAATQPLLYGPRDTTLPALPKLKPAPAPAADAPALRPDLPSVYVAPLALPRAAEAAAPL